MRPLLATALVTLLLAGCSTEDADRAAHGWGGEPTGQALTAEQAERALSDHEPQGEGDLPDGRFRFGHLIPGGSAGGRGRIASGSWDVYWTRDDGDRGAWGVGIDVFGSASQATRDVREEGAFWCPTERREIPAIATDDLDEVVAVSCRRLGGEGFYATVDAARGPVTANVTVAWPTRAAAEAALVAVWGPVHEAAVGVAGDLS